MATRQRLGDLGAEDARRFAADVTGEIRDARRILAISQGLAARNAGLSRPQFGRLERNELEQPSLEQLCRAARAVGLEPSFRLYKGEVRVRDKASLAMFGRFEALLHPSFVPPRREVPLPIPGDKRAWDLRIRNASGAASIEGESRLGDMQALARRIELKRRDDPNAGVVILLVNRTAHNRAVLAQHREALREAFPLDGAEIARNIRSGHVPRASGILLL